MRRYRVVMQNSKGQRFELVVQADSEADALLAAKQQMRKVGNKDTMVSSRAIATED